MYNMPQEMKTIQPFNLTKVIKQHLCDYSDVYILVTGDITPTGSSASTKVSFKNCDQFTRCVTHMNDEHIETAENLDMIMSMYNLLLEVCDSSKAMNKIWTMEILLMLLQTIQHLLNTNHVFLKDKLMIIMKYLKM